MDALSWLLDGRTRYPPNRMNQIGRDRPRMSRRPVTSAHRLVRRGIGARFFEFSGAGSCKGARRHLARERARRAYVLLGLLLRSNASKSLSFGCAKQVRIT